MYTPAPLADSNAKLPVSGSAQATRVLKGCGFRSRKIRAPRPRVYIRVPWAAAGPGTVSGAPGRSAAGGPDNGGRAESRPPPPCPLPPGTRPSRSQLLTSPPALAPYQRGRARAGRCGHRGAPGPRTAQGAGTQPPPPPLPPPASLCF